MEISKIGIVGNGFVGNAVYQNIKGFYRTFVYDKDETKTINTLEEVLECQVIFVCLPTPMTSADGGSCNLNIINDFFSSLPKTNSIFVIKSTVPIGTTAKLRAFRQDLKIVHNPEFLTAANAVEDFRRAERNVIGGSPEDCITVASVLKTVLPKTINIIMSSDESEAVKYFANSFLAVKVAYFNTLYDLCEKTGMDYQNIVHGIATDSRIGSSHTKTPGPDGDRGFGGTCFPKDINALIQTLKENEINANILKEVWEYNKTIRNNWDWAANKSAVLGD
jgi:UDPglucose 6-dehydrogenase